MTNNHPVSHTFVFIVQGEGRGHMTQAIAMEQLLLARGHRVSSVVVGKSARRELPHFFISRIKARIYTFESPNFVADKENKRIHLYRTLWINFLHSGRYLKSFSLIKEVLKQDKPDAVINFYEPLCGLYFLLYRPDARHICIGHQYLMQHPAFHFPMGHRTERFLVLLNTRATSFRATVLLALSFRNIETPTTKPYFKIVPPLLRSRVFESAPSNGPYILVYTVNSGYCKDIEAWHSRYPEIPLHVFSDRKDVEGEWKKDDTLTFHNLNDEKFLRMMAGCRAFVSSAGFESVCEAAYLDKPVMMVPTEGQYEQLCNALDGEESGIGVQSRNYNLTIITDYMENRQNNNIQFKIWVDSAAEKIVVAIEEAVR